MLIRHPIGKKKQTVGCKCWELTETQAGARYEGSQTIPGD